MQGVIKWKTFDAEALAIFREDSEVGGCRARRAADSDDRVAGNGPAWKANEAHLTRRHDKLAMNGVAGDFDTSRGTANGIPLAGRGGNISQRLDDENCLTE